MTDRGRSTRRSAALALLTRYAGALALLAVGLDHLQQYTADSYSAIPTIGTLFLLNFVSAAAITLGLFAPVQRLPGRAGRLAVPLLALSGVGVAAGALAGLLVSETYGLFGFMETGYRSAIVLAIVLDAVTIVLLGANLLLTRERGAAVPCVARWQDRRRAQPRRAS
jgi:hypothetical protein